MDREYKSSLRCLKIGDKVAELPIIQGGMGVGVSRSSWLAQWQQKEEWELFPQLRLDMMRLALKRPGGVQSEGNKKAHMEGKGDCQGKRAGRC